MIQAYVQIKDGFETRSDLDSTDRANIIRSVCGRSSWTLLAGVEASLAGRPRAAASVCSVVLSGEEVVALDGRSMVGTETLVWPNGDYERWELWLGDDRKRVARSKAVVTRPGR